MSLGGNARWQLLALTDEGRDKVVTFELWAQGSWKVTVLATGYGFSGDRLLSFLEELCEARCHGDLSAHQPIDYSRFSYRRL